MTDVVNAHFKRFYPTVIDLSKFEFESWLGGMWSYKDPTVEKIYSRIECADGFSMSVQGHCGAYSTPRDDFADHYSAVEVGYPSEREEPFMPYIDGEGSDPTDTVYGWVPIDVVVAVIERHGGIAKATGGDHGS